MAINLLLMHFVQSLLPLLEQDRLCTILPPPLTCPARSPDQASGDYGLVYHVAYALAYILYYILLAIWIPYFTCWVTELPMSQESLDGINGVLLLCKRVLGGALVVMQAVHSLSIFYAILRLEHKMPLLLMNSGGPSTSWKGGIWLVSRVQVAVFIGSRALQTLRTVDKGRVKTVEYVLVILPGLALLGLWPASLVKRKRGQWIIRQSLATRHVEMGVRRPGDWEDDTEDASSSSEDEKDEET